MLHIKALPPGTLPLLKELLAVPLLEGHALVGGTALALRYGHRQSVDLDLFTTESMDVSALVGTLAQRFGSRFSFRRDQLAKWAVFSHIDGIKVDIVHFPHKRVAELVLEGNFRSYADADIAPMKIEAILHRARKKDFFDLELLIRHHGLRQIMEWHRLKYPDNSIAISIPYAITYFKDAEEDENPVSLQQQTWQAVKEAIGVAVRDYLS